MAKGYWRSVERLARKRTRQELWGTQGTAVRSAILTVLYLGAVYLFSRTELARDEFGLVLLAACMPVAVYPFLFLYNELFVIPAALYRNANRRTARLREGIGVLEKRLNPGSDIDLIYNGQSIPAIHNDMIVSQPIVWAKNSRGKHQRECQLQMAVNHEDGRGLIFIPSSMPFDLKMDDAKSLVIGMWNFDELDAPFILQQYNEIGGTWELHPYDPRLPVGDYDVYLRVVSSDTKSANLHLRLFHSGKSWKVAEET